MDHTKANPLRVNEVAGRTVLSIPKVRTFLDKLVEGEKLKDAAISAGLRVSRARRLMSDPAVRRAYFREMEVLNESNRARNILLRETLRDRGLEKDAPAALAKVALEAARQLDGEQDNASITIKGGTNVIAGYVMVLEGPIAAPHAITNRSAESAKSLISHEDVTDVDG